MYICQAQAMSRVFGRIKMKDMLILKGLSCEISAAKSGIRRKVSFIGCGAEIFS